MENVKPQILIVEDEPDINELLCISLEKNNYIISKCFDGETGLKIARDSKPDLIIRFNVTWHKWYRFLQTNKK